MMTKEEILERQSAFYSKPFKFSYSSLNKLLYAPSLFYKEYVLGEKEIKTDLHLIEGKLIHYLMLDTTSFEDRFILASGSLPSDNVKTVVDIVYQVVNPTEADELGQYEDVILVTLKQINLYQKFVDDKKADKDGIKKTGDQKRLDKVLTQEAIEYFNFLKTKAGRDIIDQNTLDRCSEAVEILKDNQKVRELLGLDMTHDGSIVGIYNEIELDAEVPEMPVGIKGVIDNMVVDVKHKTVKINDLKTSNKSIKDFPESVEYWRYSLQAAIYVRLAKEFLKDVVDDTWSFEFNFIVIDKYNQVYPYKVSDSTMAKWQEELDSCLNQARWHYGNCNYTLPYEFITNEVVL